MRRGKEAMPFCPNSQSNSRVGPHGFRSNHHARYARGAKDSCCILSRRCVCHDCEKEYNAHKNELISKVSEIGLSVKEVNDEKLEDKSCTFMGHNEKSLPLLPCGYGTHFPACLTHGSDVDDDLIDLMRPLVDSGCRIESTHNLTKELHFKNYSKLMIQREHGAMKRKNEFLVNKNDVQVFSSF